MFSLLPFVALALLPFSIAQSDGSFLSDLISALQSSNLTSLANAVSQINTTSGGQALLSSLANGTSTVFAPNDQAFTSVPQNVTSNPDALTSILSYHVISGNFSGVDSMYPNVTIGRSHLNDSSLVQLEGGKSQVVVWSTREDQNVHVLNQPVDTRVVGNTMYQNITVFVIDQVLTIPKNISTTIGNSSTLSSLGQVALTVVVPSSNSSLIDILERQKGVTFFAPNNDAFTNAGSSLNNIQSNATAIFNVFRNHVLNGTTVYTAGLPSNSMTTAGGESLTVNTNSTGTFVTSGNVTARIVQSDVLVSNGVVHIIDRILFNTEVNESAASSAYESATSVAAKPTTETGPVSGPTTSGNPNNGNTNTALAARPMEVFVAALSVSVGSLFAFF